jgi:polyphenol oxidase
LQDRVAGVVPAARCVTFAGTCGLDIPAGLLAQLDAAGVGRAEAAGRCTKESADLFSYRRDGTTGRFAGLIWLSPG